MRYLLDGILIGLIFGVPVGAVGTMTVQRTYAGGVRAGLLTGLGASMADCLYAAVGAFGLTLISDFLLRWQPVIRIGGCVLILTMGVVLLLRKPPSSGQIAPLDRRGVGFILTSFAVGVANPAAILTFLFAFSSFGLTAPTGMDGFMLVGGVFIGTFLWWSALTGAVSLFKKRAGNHILPVLNRVCGAALILFGGIIIIQKG